MKNRIIEFNGLPGSGKTTILNSLVEKLDSTLNVFFLKDVYFYKEKRKIDEILVYIKILFSRKFFLLLYVLIQSVNKFDMTKERFFDILRFLKLDKKIDDLIKSEQFDLIILEEGLIQYFLSIPYLNEIKNVEKIQFFFENTINYLENIEVINLEINIEDSRFRIKNRIHENGNFNLRRIDSLASEDQIYALQMNYKNLEKLRTVFKNSIYLDTENTIIKNVEIILNKLY